MKRAEAEKLEARERLLAEPFAIKPGDTIHCILRHVSRSGMQRRISLVKIDGGETGHLDGLVARLLGMKLREREEGIVIGGCGMDMGFALVYDLSHTLWPNGYGCTGEGCRSNDHSNGDGDYTPHGCTDENGIAENREPGPGETLDGCKRHWHRDGGYALRHRWL